MPFFNMKKSSVRRSKRNNKNNNNNKSTLNKLNSAQEMSSIEEINVTQEEIFINEEPNSLEYNPTTTTSIINNPAQKRLRDNYQMSNTSKSLTNIDSPFKSLNIIDKRFDKLTTEIETMINNKLTECKTELLNMFDKSFSIIKTELKNVTERVQQLETAADSIKSMQIEITSLKTKLKLQENKNVACELRLSEIPYKENENLYLLFEKICNSINITVPAVKTIYRLQNANNKKKNNSKDAVIIVKMWSPYDKNYFLKSFANYRKINKGFNFCLKHLGESSNNKFFVNENLTQYNYTILRAAIKLKKENRLHSAFSMRGLVYIKKTAESNIIRVDDIVYLDDFFREPEPAPNANEIFDSSSY